MTLFSSDGPFGSDHEFCRSPRLMPLLLQAAIAPALVPAGFAFEVAFSRTCFGLTSTGLPMSHR